MIFFKSTNKLWVSNIITELIPLNNIGWKKEVSEVFLFIIK